MTLIFSGHGFRYETEAVAKLFFPAQPFSFTEDGSKEIFLNTPGPCCLTLRDIDGGGAKLYAAAKIGESTEERQGFVSGSDPDFEHSCELGLCRLMFECLSALTGIRPGWGVLTGVRPVKLVSRLMAGGMSREELYLHMRDRLYVAPEKTALALSVAENQSAVTAALPPRSFSLYVSIPFCPSRCSYCSFVSETVGSCFGLIPEYIRLLGEEISYTAKRAGDLGLKLDTVYFGGGTPTAIGAEDLETLMRAISRGFDISGIREYTVEAGRPDTVTEEKLKVIKDNGADRVSVNPQTLRQSVLDAVGRRHTVEQFFEAYGLARRQGFKAVNVDLIAGLPTDDEEGFKSTLNRVVGLEPENITVHALSIKRAADLGRGGAPVSGAEAAANMIAYSESFLSEAGYKPYYLYRQKNQLGNLENVGYERGGTPGIYNVNMMEEIQTVIAVGAGASTKVVSGEKDIKRYYNPKYPLEYIRRFDETVKARKAEAFLRIENILESKGKLNV